jgi:uncharacterized membrane protein YphA (DoxX/SURF4 family)
MTAQHSTVKLAVLPTIARILMGLMFFVFGLNIFLHFIPMPHQPMPAAMVAFATAMANTGYFMKLVGATQVLTGVLLLSNRFVPLALALIAPVIVNIIAFHCFLQPAGIGPGAFAAVLEIYLAWSYRISFLPMLARKTSPSWV